MAGAQPQAPSQPRTPGGAMLRTLGGIAMLSGLLVVLVYHWTRPIIAENKRIAIEKAIFQVVPGAVTRKNFVLGPEGLFPGDAGKAKGDQVYAAYDRDGRLKGVALEAAATGYQDVIRILYGYDPGCQCVTGIRVLKMAETPGLGDKIARDPDFLANFEALDGRVNAAGDGLEHAIVTVKHGTKSQPWQIDAISGATISSKAVGRMIDASGQRMFPLILRYRDGFERRD
ncbi:MAG TPA: FMN-binding protein [Sedimenticola thiotaurini]|uniref:Ion-translocating oxidoreductase complex subunit G n=1 Tax=Sedimenticola thiotaurini TaxID=1543721 RepID=A0A831W666_9GAMM|nr:FMN-binding protein [Sedimenticola thiotaurini]